MSATTTHQGLPEGLQPFALLELIESLKAELGLKDQDITYLRWVFRHVKRTDFIAGRICAVWMSVAKLTYACSSFIRSMRRSTECGPWKEVFLTETQRRFRKKWKSWLLRWVGKKRS